MTPTASSLTRGRTPGSRRGDHPITTWYTLDESVWAPSTWAAVALSLFAALMLVLTTGCSGGAGLKLGPNGLETEASADLPELNAGRVSFSTAADARATAALPPLRGVHEVGYRVSSSFHQDGKLSVMLVPLGADRAILDGNVRVHFDVSSNVRFPIEGSATIGAVRPGSDRPTQVVIDLDGSGSMKGSDPQRRRVQAALRFVDTLARSNAKNEFAVLEFSSSVSTRASMGSSLAATRTAIAGVESKGGTKLFDSLIRSIDLLEAEGKPGYRKAILVLTDGKDTSSKATLEQVIARAKRAKVTVYAMSLGGARDMPNLGFVGPMQTLTAQTRGIFVHVDRAESLVARFEAMALAQTTGWIEADVQLRGLGGVFVPLSTITVQMTVESGGATAKPRPLQFVVPLRLGS